MQMIDRNIRQALALDQENKRTKPAPSVLVKGVVTEVAVIVVVVQNHCAQAVLFECCLSPYHPLVAHALRIVGAILVINCIGSILHRFKPPLLSIIK